MLVSCCNCCKKQSQNCQQQRPPEIQLPLFWGGARHRPSFSADDGRVSLFAEKGEIKKTLIGGRELPMRYGAL